MWWLKILAAVLFFFSVAGGEAIAYDREYEHGYSDGLLGREAYWGRTPRYRLGWLDGADDRLSGKQRQYDRGYYTEFAPGRYYSESWGPGYRGSSWSRSYSTPKSSYYESGGAQWSAPSYRPRW